ncbi:MAG: bifunctional folylpolyglutamate synthase/dihydrofolate synthase [Bacteroidales bacterium]|nr:bifunctional folylpolyglutamate synthase/dihydrofolate synthase [Bacteroidales bacterium]
MEDFSESKYAEMLERIFRLSPSVQSKGFSPDAYKPGLDAMRRFDDALGNPWRSYRIIHVAGTNGKGSVCSMITASLAASGFVVGLYTSPHISDFRERCRIVGRDGSRLIEKQEVWEFFQMFNTEGLSFFEITTGLALWWFARKKVDYAVIETGLGGRLDSTNIITPVLTIITSIGLDHCAILGNTRSAIAAEKAGIFKSGVPALVGDDDAEVSPVFEAKASAVGAPLFYAAGVRTPEISGHDLDSPMWEQNLHIVSKAFEILGVRLNPEGIAHTKALTAFRGRWDCVSKNPEIITDIGHNSAALSHNFERLVRSGRPLIIVFGIMADKDLDSIAPLMPADATYILCAPACSRSLDAEELLRRLAVLRPDLQLRAAGSVAAGVAEAIELAKSLDNPLIYAGGSTFVVSEAFEYLGI